MVLPAAMAREVTVEPKVVALARNAPTATAAQTRFPHSRNAASAKPLGGQIGLALGCSEASVSPSLARTK